MLTLKWRGRFSQNIELCNKIGRVRRINKTRKTQIIAPSLNFRFHCPVLYCHYSAIEATV